MLQLPKTLFPFFWHFIKKDWLAFLLIQIFSLAMTLDNVFWPQVITLAVERIEAFRGNRENIMLTLYDVVVYGAILWLIIEVFFRLSGIYMMKAIPKFEARMRMAVYEYVSQQSHTFFSDTFAGSISNKINDIARSGSSVIVLIMGLFFPVLLTFIISIYMFALISPFFAAVLTTWIIIHITICVASARRCQELASEHAESKSDLTGRIVDSINNNISTRIFARRKYEHSYIKHFQMVEIEKHTIEKRYIEKVKIYLGIFGFLFMGVFMTWLQIDAYKREIIDIGKLVFIFQASINIMAAAWWAGLELPRFFQELGICQQSLSLINMPIKVLDRRNAHGKIEFQNVTFRYEKNSNIFEDKNIIIKPKQKIGLVGFSGSGKTTFVNLLLRYFDIHEGQILIDGQNIADVTQDSLRSNISFIPQEPNLFHRSLMENIRYGDINATDKEVIEAAKKAHCHEFITKLKNGYQTIVGERGSKLSGGQRQRIAIARAILKRAPIVIMDEATSALDSETENKIQESLVDIIKNKTTIIIAHRLSTLSGMNRILVFKEGDIVEDGTHEELIKLRGHYFKLWTLQANGILPDKELASSNEIWDEEEVE